MTRLLQMLVGVASGLTAWAIERYLGQKEAR